MKSVFFIILFFTLLKSPCALVEPPNYNFKIDYFDPFLPGKKFETVKEKYKGISIVKKTGENFVYKISIIEKGFRFPLFLQVENGISRGFFARLPSYFSHDKFHQALIDKYKKQNKYYKQENNAVYIWNDVKGSKIIYSGSCTNVCFPIYISIFPATIKEGGKPPLINEFMNVDLFRAN